MVDKQLNDIRSLKAIQQSLEKHAVSPQADCCSNSKVKADLLLNRLQWFT